MGNALSALLFIREVGKAKLRLLVLCSGNHSCWGNCVTPSIKPELAAYKASALAPVLTSLSFLALSLTLSYTTYPCSIESLIGSLWNLLALHTVLSGWVDF